MDTSFGKVTLTVIHCGGLPAFAANTLSAACRAFPMRNSSTRSPRQHLAEQFLASQFFVHELLSLQRHLLFQVRRIFLHPFQQKLHDTLPFEPANFLDPFPDFYKWWSGHRIFGPTVFHQHKQLWRTRATWNWWSNWRRSAAGNLRKW